MKGPEGNPITTSVDLLSTLLTKIPQNHHFRAKWSLIKAKLSLLDSHFSDFADFPCSTSNPLSLHLLHAVSQTLVDAISLADICQSLDLAAGKLKTQSDLDSVIAKLDCHLQDADVLIKSRVLLQDGLVLAAASSSKREAVRAEARNLITRLQIGSAESKNSAMDSLLGLLQEDDKNVMIAVAQGVVPVLVKLLDSGSLEVKEKTVAAISRVSTVESGKQVLIAEGLLLLNHLLRVLESGSGFAKEKACVALQALSYSKENARAIGSRGGISSLLEICAAGTPGSQAFAAGVLRNLALFREIRENLVEENAVVVLLGLAASGTALAQENAFGCLSNLVSEDDNLKLWVVREKGIECLKNYWDASPSPSPSPGPGESESRSLEVAVGLLGRLASYLPIGEAIVAEGFIPRLCSAIKGRVLGVRVAAARCLCELGLSSGSRKEIGEEGCIGGLTKMLEGKAVEEKEAAARALSNLLSYSGNRRAFRKEERGIVGAVQLLDPAIENVEKKYPVSVLWWVMNSSKCRKQMVAAGACVHLRKLAEMEVEGAKKMYETLRRGKTWNIFSRP